MSTDVERPRAGVRPIGPADAEGDRAPVTIHPGLVVVPVALALAVVAGLSSLVSPALPVAIVLAVIVIAAAWHRPIVAAIIVAAIVPALAGLERGLVVPSLKVSEALLVVCVVAVALRRPTRWRAMTGVDVALVLFAVVTAGLAALHEATDGLTPQIEPLLRVGLLPAFLFLTWWTVSRSVEGREDLLVVMRWVLLFSLLPALLGIAQYFDVLGVRELIITIVGEGNQPRPGGEQSRITGPFTIAHSFGGYLLIPLILGVVLLLRGDREVLPRPLLAAVVTVDVIAMVLAVTVTLVLWVPVAVLVAAAMVRRLGVAPVLLALVAMGSLALFPDAIESRLDAQTSATTGTTDSAVPQTLQFRILVWQRDYLPLMGQAAPIGLGTDTPEGVFFTHTENQYLTFILRGGVPLLLAALIGLGAVALRAWRTYRTTEGIQQTGAVTVFAIMTFLPAAAMVWPYVTNAGLPQSLLGFAGAALAMSGARKVRRPTYFGPPPAALPPPVPALGG